jgi:transposase
MGTLIKIEMLVELQYVSRFKSANKFLAHIGLTPSTYYTARKSVRKGKIIKSGNTGAKACSV